MTPLPPKKRSELRAEAHTLSPLVIIGDKGLTDEVLAEIDRTLRAHELIKVRAATNEREARDTWLEKICESLAAHPVQQIGKVFVLYRENPEKKAAAKSVPAPALRRSGTGDDKRVRGETERARGDDKRTPTDKKLGRGFDKRTPSKTKVGRGFDKRTTSENKRGRGDDKPVPSDTRRARGDDKGEVKRTSRPRSRTPSPRPESEPRRRRPRTSR